MKAYTDVAIIGAGPYALSLAAHLRDSGLSLRIFGKPLDTWREHMPAGMFLKSDGFASNLYAPAPGSTLKDYCAQNDLPYHDTDKPVRLDVFNAYAQSFQQRFVPNVEAKEVSVLERRDHDFVLTLETGEQLVARHVVLAVGITHFANMPEELKRIPTNFRTHSFHHRDPGRFHRSEVVVIGAGASAMDIAAELLDNGASVRIVAREKAVRWHNPPTTRHLLSRLVRPSSGIGPGWKSFFCAKLPQLFHALPQSLRLRVARRHLGAAPGWFTRARVENRIVVDLETEFVGATLRGHRVGLTVASGGEERDIVCDYVIAATGYKPDLNRLDFLDLRLLHEIRQENDTPVLSGEFETSVHGLYVIGPAAANSFGPLMRFMVGAQYTSPLLARHLKQRLKHSARARALPSRTFKPA